MDERISFFKRGSIQGFVLDSEITFLYGLTSLAQARKVKEDIWKRRGHEFVKKVKNLAKDYPSSYQHKLLLLEAESAFNAGRKSIASEKYEQAVTLSRNNEFVQDQALCCELAGKFYAEHDNKYKASHYYGKAHELYLEWGAK
eukprot:15356065-Ditylum_brightwellii.AAC.1